MTISIDFEFNKSNESHMGLVCACILYKEETHYFWLLTEEGKNSLREFLSKQRDECILSFSCGAEARCFLALGINPLLYRWVDPRIAYLLATNGLFREMNALTKSSLINVQYYCGVGTNDLIADQNLHKEQMRALILSKSDFTETEKINILEYCAEDVRLLPAMLQRLIPEISNAYDQTPGQVAHTLQYLSRYTVAVAVLEQRGFPIDQTALENLGRNAPLAIKQAIDDCNKTYPFYDAKYVKKDKTFAEFVESKGLAEQWPRTEKSGKYKTDEKIRDKYDYLPEVRVLSHTLTMVSNLNRFRPKCMSDLAGRTGTDGRLRADFNVFGTITGRGSPPARTFIPAMPAWFHALIKPNSGYLTEIDYGNQEFGIAAWLSRDKNMVDAYHSGDPYLYFAQLCGAIPAGGTKKTHPEVRQLFKSTVLGLQYGMGRHKLALKLTGDCGREVEESEAEELLNLHRATFGTYWDWSEAVREELKANGYLLLADGWAIRFTVDNSMRTYNNFPIQGTAQCILRRAIIDGVTARLGIICSVHDSIYLLHSTPEEVTQLDVIMDRASREVLGMGIRRDISTHPYTETWVTDKGRKDFETFGKYLQEIVV